MILIYLHVETFINTLKCFFGSQVSLRQTGSKTVFIHNHKIITVERNSEASNWKAISKLVV